MSYAVMWKQASIFLKLLNHPATKKINFWKLMSPAHARTFTDAEIMNGKKKLEKESQYGKWKRRGKKILTRISSFPLP